MHLDWLKRAFGVLPQEYLCVAEEDVAGTPSVYVSSRNSNTITDVTENQLLLGYKPLVMALKSDEDADDVCLTFGKPSQEIIRSRGYLTHASCLARIELKRLDCSFDIPGWRLFLGVYGEHRFLRTHQRLANSARILMQRKPASDANISGNLYEQVRIAYSTPRPISVITVKDEDLLNFFPTDLHGRLDSEHYISSLRIGGMACAQVQTCTKIVISTVDAAAFKDVYALGKNHMRELQPENNFQSSRFTSPSGIPVYPLATKYLELDVMRHEDIGIHRLFLYRVKAEAAVATGKTLAHLHAWYVQWRLNQGISTEYFLR